MSKSQVQNIFILICYFVLVAGLQAQQQHQLGMFQSRSSDNPEIAGEGITRHLINGDNLMAQGQFENAILSFDNAVAQNPYFAEAYIKRAIAKYRLGRITEAREDYEFATRINPYVGDLYGYGNNLRKLKVMAFEPYELAGRLSLDRRLEYYQRLLGPSLVEVEGGPLARVEALSEYISEFPESTPHLLERALQYLQAGAYKRAIYDLQTVININPNDAIAYSLIGLAHLETDAPQTVVEQAFERAVELEPRLAIAVYNLGVARQQQLRYGDALALFSRAIELDPTLEVAYFNRALVHKAMGNLDAAMKDYSHLLGEGGQEEAKVWLNRGIARKMSGDIMGALADIEQAIRMAPDDNAVLYQLRGNIQLLLGNYLAAEQDYTRSIELDPGFAESYYNRGVARILDYNRPDACRDFRESADLGYGRGEEQLQYLCSY